jgi:hypothetical protein
MVNTSTSPPLFLTSQLVVAEKHSEILNYFIIPDRIRNAGRIRNGALLVWVLNEKTPSQGFTALIDDSRSLNSRK